MPATSNAGIYWDFPSVLLTLFSRSVYVHHVCSCFSPPACVMCMSDMFRNSTSIYRAQHHLLIHLGRYLVQVCPHWFSNLLFGCTHYAKKSSPETTLSLIVSIASKEALACLGSIPMHLWCTSHSSIDTTPPHWCLGRETLSWKSYRAVVHGLACLRCVS